MRPVVYLPQAVQRLSNFLRLSTCMLGCACVCMCGTFDKLKSRSFSVSPVQSAVRSRPMSRVCVRSTFLFVVMTTCTRLCTKYFYKTDQLTCLDTVIPKVMSSLACPFFVYCPLPFFHPVFIGFD